MDLALFDFDGTITTRETFGDFVARSVPRGRLALGKLLLAPLVVGYRFGVVPGTVVRARVVRFGYAGMASNEVAAAGARYAREVLPTLLRPEALARIRWHRERGDTVAVVSGAFDCYLAPWCAELRVELLCSALEIRDGVLSGRYAGTQCVGAEKVRRVRERFDLDAFGAIYAYGDTCEDLDLLGLAGKRYYRWKEAA